jgi:hypothetical protein
VATLGEGARAADVRREVRDALLATIRSSTRPLYSRTEARRAWPRRSHLRLVSSSPQQHDYLHRGEHGHAGRSA